ncbi:hypothetical protein [Thermomonospora echinospora]|uniref:hypothetical protein n=1 Tax=Thermomonospora echinospora TaxID=1992 RepID=UPI001F2CFDDF|nr:hypothetical protein [Thermomonospora echinospora]
MATSLNDAGFVHAISPEVGHIDVPDTVANVISSSWTGCRGPINLTFGVTHAGTWTLQAISENSSTHVIKGRISGVHATIAGTGCSAMVSGSARGTYDNSAKTLTISEPGGTSGGLIVSGASCLGILANGDKPSFNATFSVTGNIAVHRNH